MRTLSPFSFFEYKLYRIGKIEENIFREDIMDKKDSELQKKFHKIAKEAEPKPNLL